MDIQILLALQNLRESLPGFVEKFFVCFSYIGDGPALAALALIVYWCIDKRTGQFALMCFVASNLVGQFLKNIVCAYRPWIRDASIVPSADAIEGATGYSFPSGHTNGAGTILGSIAWLERKKHVAVTVICVIVVLLIAFSRNFLGVHTPQDVLVGLALAIAMIACTNMLLNWIDRYDAFMPGHGKDVLVVVVACAVAIATLVIVTVKPYTVEYVDGIALIDVEQMMKGSYEASGLVIGVSLGWLCERRLVGYATTGIAMKERVVRGIIGVAFVGVTYVLGKVALEALLPYLWAKFLTYLVLTFVGLFIAPLVFERIAVRFAGEGAE